MWRGGEDGEERAADETRLDQDTFSKSEQWDGVFDLATPGLGAGEGEDSHVRLRSQGVTQQEVKLLKSRGNIQQ